MPTLAAYPTPVAALSAVFTSLISGVRHLGLVWPPAGSPCFFGSIPRRNLPICGRFCTIITLVCSVIWAFEGPSVRVTPIIVTPKRAKGSLQMCLQTLATWCSLGA